MKTMIMMLAMLFSTSEMNSALASEKRKARETNLIHFHGRIVEAGCTTRIAQQRLETRCFDGRHHVLQHFSLASHHGLPGNLGWKEMRWVDERHQTGIAVLSYHKKKVVIT